MYMLQVLKKKKKKGGGKNTELKQSPLPNLP